MSTIGTGVAAGVAQTAHQAQQVARRRDRRDAEATRLAQDLDEHLDLQQHTVEEYGETPLDLRVDDRREGAHPEGKGRRGKLGHQPDEQDKPQGDEGLYRHLDVTA